MAQPVPPPTGIALPPLNMRYDVIDMGGQGFVRFQFDHGLSSMMFAVPVDTAVKFGNDIKHMCQEAVEGYKQASRKSLLVPQKQLLIPGSN